MFNRTNVTVANVRSWIGTADRQRIYMSAAVEAGMHRTPRRNYAAAVAAVVTASANQRY